MTVDKSKHESADKGGEVDGTDEPSTNFIREIIDEDLKKSKSSDVVATRFPPEPNGYLHIGHAKSICLNFGLAAHYKGTCNLRFDDTNPSTEDAEYVNAIIEDVKWLGFSWNGEVRYASDYFEKFYEYAVELVKKGLAYVESASLEEIRKGRGNFTTPGEDSPYRGRSPEENLELLGKMRAGDFEDGAHVLRAKIDMGAPNMNLRDPIMYRIRRATHHRTGDDWCIYPMYDFAHGLEDAVEGITHSICTLEFENHRPLYDWFLDNIGVPCHPRQIEFARLNLSYTVMSKRKLLELVEKGLVSGWDDPRMPTISGMRRRGYTPEAIRNFCDRIGVAKRDNTVDMALLEHTVREDLNDRTPRVMAVLNPLKVVIENFEEGRIEEFDAPLHPEDPTYGSRKIPLTREIYIERDDFRLEAPKKWHRLAPGREVRLRYACLLRCVSVVTDEKSGEVTQLRCTWDPDSKGGTSPDGRKVRGTIHFVSVPFAVEGEVRLYDRLFTKSNPLDAKEGGHFIDYLNPDSLSVLEGCKLEPSLKRARSGYRCQFERLGYFFVDTVDSREDRLVFNRTISLRDSWARIEKANKKNAVHSKKKKDSAPKEPDDKIITISQFAKLDIRVGVVEEAGLVEGADKLVRLVLGIGGPDPIQVFSGIRSHYGEPGKLVGSKVMVLVNLKPRKMRFGVSQGMVLTGGDDDRLALATFAGDVLPGDKVS